MREFRDDLAEWRQWQAILDMTVGFVGSEGLHAKTAAQLSRKLRPLLRTAEGRRLAAELVRFVRGASEQGQAGRTSARQHRSVGVVLREIQGVGEGPSQGGIHQSVAGIRDVVCRGDDREGLGSDASGTDKADQRLVRGAYRADLILPAKGGVRPGTDCATKTGRSNPVIRGTFSSGQDRAPWRHDPSADPATKTEGGRHDAALFSPSGLVPKRQIDP